MNEPRNIKELLKKLTEGTISKAEREILENWYRKNSVRGIQHLMDEDWKQTLPLDKVPKSMEWESFKIALDGKSKRPARVVNRWMAVAASITALIIIGLGYLKLQDAQPQIVEITNTLSGKKEVRLEDGTVVWLNRGSRILFNEPFSEEFRKVELCGEAFFEVRRDSTTPFIVSTGQVKTKVLGTSFNVRAYPERKDVNIALVEGKVQVNYAGNDSVFLLPGEQFAFDKNEERGRKTRFEEDEPYAWKDGIIYFDKDDIYEITRILEEWYDVTFILEEASSMKTELVHRIDTRKRTLEQVLDHISRVADYSFEMKSKKEIIVRPKTKK